MSKRQGITDEELGHFKDFDALLVKHNQTTSGRNTWLKGISLGAILIAGIITTIYFVNQQEPTLVKQEPQSIERKVEPVQEEIKSKRESTSSPDIKKKEVKRQEEIPIETDAAPAEAIAVSPVYVQAEPIEGYARLYEYFNRELIYPQVAVKDSIQGVLTVSFTISRNGSVENIQFANTLGVPFEEEAIRLIKNMPLWKPATVNGQPVPSKMSLPLTFQIQKVEKK